MLGGIKRLKKAQIKGLSESVYKFSDPGLYVLSHFFQFLFSAVELK